MNFSDSNTPQTAAILRTIADAQPALPVDLWSRIEAKHAMRVRRWRRHRLAAGGVLGVALIGALALGGLRLPSTTPNRGAEIDWQARAQALELQLQTLERGNGAPAATVSVYNADPATTELAEVDRLLQAAYEHGKYTNELTPLWKRRSELLDALIAARKEGLILTSI
jgi:hypothetical protein